MMKQLFRVRQISSTNTALSVLFLLCNIFGGIAFVADAAKARVNILLFASGYDWLMAAASTYNGSANAGRAFNASVAPNYNGEPWMGNAQLKNVDMYYITRDTNYSVAWNPLNSVRILMTDYGVLSAATALQRATQIHMLAGPTYSGEAKGLGQVTTLFNNLMISGSATSPDMADHQHYPSFYRTVPSDADFPLVAIQKFREMGYNQVTTLCFTDDFITDFIARLALALVANNMVEENRFLLYDNTDGANVAHPHWMDYFTNAANGLKNAQSHVWLAVIGGQAYQQYQLLCALYKAGITGAEYQGFLFGSPTSEAAWWYEGVGDDKLYNGACTRDNIETVLLGVIVGVQSAAFDDTPVDYINITPATFHTDFTAEMVRSQRPVSAGLFQIFNYYTMDAMTACALALDYAQGQMMTNNQTTLDVINAPAPYNFTYTGANDSMLFTYTSQFLANLTFRGLTGSVSFNGSTGDRVARLFSAFQLQKKGSNTLPRIAKITATNNGITITTDQPAVYPTTDGNPPPQSSSASTAIAIGVGVAGGIILLLGIPLAVWLTRRHLQNVALKAAIAGAQNWIIDPATLTSDKMGAGMANSMLAASMASMNQAASMQSMGITSGNTGSGVVRPYTTFNHNQNRVNAFVLRRKEHSLDQEIVKQMMTVQACSSDNTSRFVGISMLMTKRVEEPTMHCIMAGSVKGSLADFLAGHRASGEGLDDVFTFSLIRDLHKGLTDIHRVTGFHGRLSSTICMVDNRMSLRVSDYGFSSYRLPAFYDIVINIDHELFMWCAPEVLKQFSTALQSSMWPNALLPYPSLVPTEWVLADVYSYGIICSEVFTVNRPFTAATEEAKCTTTEFLQRIADEPTRPSDMIRSAIQNDKVMLAADISEMILKCVAGDPTARPSLSDIGSSLRAMVKIRKLSSNITEMLMQQLESYAKNLEGIVAQRTEALAVEQEKVTKLLHQILPPSVADALKNGEIVPPKEYDSVTIYFSDVVGFTTISAASTPFQIVDLLNDLYNAFDNILSTFDVYKVETIGDAYMVVSGLPKPNGHQHVRNIGLMSLALIDHVKTKFVIRHRPNEQLRLRIGMHSGSCASGVVGFVMPRYCLFGDTVNTASRMESNGEPLRIHVSETSATLIKEQGFADGSADADFVLTPRGEIEVKGKGLMKTFWMTKPGDPVPENVPPPVAGHH